MYIPQHFAETRTEVLHALIKAHPFAAMVVLGPDGLNVNHLPFLIDAGAGEFGTLRGHVARANPVWKSFVDDYEAVAIFQGPQHYITPSWYPSKKTMGGKVVPTWNYAVVHAHGPLRIMEDKEWLFNLVSDLTDQNEAPRAEPWKTTDAPADFIDKMLKAIVGIEIPITRIEGKWKTNQNRTQQDRRGVIDGLSRENTAAASAMADLVPIDE